MRLSVRHKIFLGVLFALAVTLSLAEALIPPLPVLPPGVKLGLSNIVTMYCLFCIGRKEAILLVCLKSLFAVITRGATAGLLSFSGGLLSVLALSLCLRLFRQRISYTALSMIGAVCHNLGQLTAASLLVDTPLYFVYLPILLVSGVLMGTATGLLLRALLPFLRTASAREGGALHG